LVDMARLRDGARPLPPLGSGGLPAHGVRVLDLTRVIAGPVGTRMLAALGAQVLRVDDPHRPELPGQDVEGVLGKASTLLDARTPAGHEILHRLLDGADVLVTGYRPEIGRDTSELQSPYDLVCRLLLEKKNTISTSARAY